MMRLAYEWKVIDRVPRVRLLRGEKNRESIRPHDREAVYLAALPQPVSDVATVLLDTGLRLGELISLDWAQAHIEPANGAVYGYLTILSGKAKITGNTQKLGEFVSWLDNFDFWFNIVTP